MYHDTRIKKLIPQLYLSQSDYEMGVNMFTEWSKHDGESMYTENKSDKEIINAFYEYYHSYNTNQPGVPKNKIGGKKSRKMRKSRKYKRSRKSRRHRH